MKFTNTKSQVKEVGTNAVAFGKATVALTKSVVKVPIAICKDTSEIHKGLVEDRKRFREWKAQQDAQPDA